MPPTGLLTPLCQQRSNNALEVARAPICWHVCHELATNRPVIPATEEIVMNGTTEGTPSGSARMLLAATLISGLAGTPALAQDKSRIPAVGIYQAMLQANKEPGWVKFRNYGGAQWVYFTALQTLHCRLKEIRYSINSKELDKRFDLVKCNPQNPFAVPPDAGVDDIAIRLPAGSATRIAVQVVWEDDTESAIAVYEPCKDVGEQTCAWPLE